MDGTATAGRKGLPYDWRALLEEHRAGHAPQDEGRATPTRPAGGGLPALVEALA